MLKRPWALGPTYSLVLASKTLTRQQTWLQRPAHSMVIPSILFDEASLRQETMLNHRSHDCQRKLSGGLKQWLSQQTKWPRGGQEQLPKAASGVKQSAGTQRLWSVWGRAAEAGQARTHSTPKALSSLPVQSSCHTAGPTVTSTAYSSGLRLQTRSTKLNLTVLTPSSNTVKKSGLEVETRFYKEFNKTEKEETLSLLHSAFSPR